MEKKQTAVEWYANASHELIVKKNNGEITNTDFLIMHHNLFYEAKQMEKEQKKLELPSDEQIDDEATNYIENASAYSFVMGAKWMRDKIKGGNNE